MLLITYQEPLVEKIIPFWGVTLRGFPTQGEILVCSLLLSRGVQQALGFPLFMEHDNWLMVIFAYQPHMLTSPKFSLSQTLFNAVVRWVHYSDERLAVVLLSVSNLSWIQPPWPDTSMMTPLVVFTQRELQEIKNRLGEGGKAHCLRKRKKNWEL